MKKILIISLLGLTILAIPVFIIMQQRANDHRVAAITAHHSALEAVFLANGVSAQDITRQEGCARTQEKYGEGSKYCGRDLSAKYADLTVTEAQDVAALVHQQVSSDNAAKMDHEHNPVLSRIGIEPQGHNGYLYYSLDHSTHCRTDIMYAIRANELGQKIIAGTTTGDLEIRVGCQDNSWWLRTFGG